ncbi:hypothetical protein D5F52_26520 (plasmid) [Brevibacillus laterosporus]|nr:hypothetical protein D5F52_26520 [Brevibacillus laterosporus]
MEKVIENLLENGFVPDGHTDVTVERNRSVIGGRIRYKRGLIFVTVGKEQPAFIKKRESKSYGEEISK